MNIAVFHYAGNSAIEGTRLPFVPLIYHVPPIYHFTIVVQGIQIGRVVMDRLNGPAGAEWSSKDRIFMETHDDLTAAKRSSQCRIFSQYTMIQ